MGVPADPAPAHPERTARTVDLPSLTWPLALTVVAALIDFAVRIVAIAVVPSNRRPSSAMAWLLAIFFIPYLGIAAFLLIGSPKLPRARRKKQRAINDLILRGTRGLDQVEKTQPWPVWFASVVKLNRNLGSMPLVGENEASLLGHYESSIKVMTEAVDQARHYVHAEFYILSLDPTTAPFFDALERAVERGVVVRVLLDHIASLRSPGYGYTTRRLTAMGALWHPMLPLQPLRGKIRRPDLRNHRKLLVVDGEVGFTGSQNMIDRGYNKASNAKRGLQWQDLMARFEGPIVAGINALFVTDWYSETDELLSTETEDIPPHHDDRPLDCQVVPSGPGFAGENNLKLFNALMYNAQQRISLTSPYFVPDESMLQAVTTAAERGVEVELFVSEIGDQWLVYHAQRSYYEALLRAGVKIRLYPAPYVLHAKHMTVDDDVSVIGSSNMDMRSFSLNMEVSVLVRGTSFAEDLRSVEDGYRRQSRVLRLEDWMDRPWRMKFLDNVCRLTSALQ